MFLTQKLASLILQAANHSEVPSAEIASFPELAGILDYSMS